MSPRILRWLCLALLSAPLAAAPRSCHLCLFGPDNMAFSRSGTVYLVDTDHHLRPRVLVLTASGSVLRSFALFTPSISAADAARHRVRWYSPQGKLLGTVTNHPGVHLFRGGPESLAVGLHGSLYAADGLSVIKFTRSGRLIARWR